MNCCVRIVVREGSSVGASRREAALLAENLGFSEETVGRVGIVVTEAANNLVKHANGGEILLREVGDKGLELLAIDKGPGMQDLAKCFTDGYSTTGSPGTGLGAIVRLSDSYDLYSQVGHGTVLMSRIWQKPPPADRLKFLTGVICVPFPGETLCGDSWSVRRNRNETRLLLVDGLGHGVLAAQAADEAVTAFAELDTYSTVETVQALNTVLRRTRGASVAVLAIRDGENTLRFVGVGNLSGSIVQHSQSRGLVSLPGTVGHQCPKLQEFVYTWPAEATLILHSDGLSARWHLSAYSGLLSRHPSVIAGTLYRDFRRERDDVTVLVLREAAGQENEKKYKTASTSSRTGAGPLGTREV